MNTETVERPQERPGIERPDIRRFEMPDLPRHGGWLLPRLVKKYPHLTEQLAAGFLNGAITSNEYLFLFQPHSVALAQIERAFGLTPRPLVSEVFVWAESSQYVAEAAWFYGRFRQWAKHIGADVIVLGDSDVSADIIKEHLGRVYQRQQQFTRVSD